MLILKGSSLRNLKWKDVDVSFGGAVCIPNECGNDVIKSITDQLFKGKDLNLSTDYEQQEICQVQKPPSFGFNNYLMM